LPPRFSSGIGHVRVAKTLEKDGACDFAAGLTAATRFAGQLPMQLCGNSDGEHG
jgi:hypothetical protein